MMVVLGITLLAGCGESTSGSEAESNIALTLVAYSTPREAYEKIIAAYRETQKGENVTFETSFGASGEQSRAVSAGLEADLVALSLEPDVTRLVAEDLVAEDWSQADYQGMVTDSVVVLVVREGNPKNIATWDDLIRPGIEVITPNPLTSGGAKWNIMAAYGAQLRLGKSHDESVEYLRALMANVPVQDKSAREALQTFIGGKGDVMIAYENEAITIQKQGETVEYVVPDETILIENPVALVTGSENPDATNAFIDFLRSAEAQRIYAEQGYRPVVPEILAETDFPQPPDLFTIADLGGWPEVNKTFFDAESGIMAEIERGQ